MSKISITTLGSLIEFQRGYDLPKTSFVEGDVPVISSNGILGYHNEYKVKGPGITIGRSGTVGLPHYIEENFYPHNTSLFIKDFKGNNPKYIYYLLKTLGLNDRGSGSGVPTMNRNHLHPLKVRAYLNPIYQEGIANVLTSIDSKIALNNRINAELEAMAKTVYDYWFVQFDFPFDFAQGKPSAEGKPYKSSGGKMVWREELKREVPEGWEVKKLKEIADTGSGGTPLSSEKAYYENGNIPWINSGEVNEPFIVSAKKFITQKGVDNSSAKLFNKGTILMAMYGATAGKVSIMDIEATTNQAVCGIMPKQEYFRAYLKLGLDDLYRYLINLSTGSARDNLSQDKIRELHFIIPDESILKAFDKIADSAMSKILSNMKENQQLSSLRDWLLPMLMNGQVKVGKQPLAPEGEQEMERLMAAEPGVNYERK